MGKRANGEGTFHHRDNGRWEAQVMVGYRPNGTRDIHSFSAATKNAVKAKMDSFLADRASGLLKGSQMPFREFADKWYAQKCHAVSETTAEGYKYTLRILKEHFQQNLSDINVMDIEAFLIRLKADGFSDSMVSKCRGMLFQIFQKAVACQLLNRNVVQYAEKIRRDSPKRRDAFTEDEVRYLMKNLPHNKIGYSVRILLSTGLRPGELLGLERNHIAEDGSYIVIMQAVKRCKGSILIGPPKSHSSYRTVMVPPAFRYCALALRDTNDKFIWNSPKKPDQPCNPSWFTAQFKKALEEVGNVRVLTPHCCRHTFVSMMQMIGVDFETIRFASGHAEIDMTRHYLHVQAPKQLDAAQRFSDAFEAEGTDIGNGIAEATYCHSY